MYEDFYNLHEAPFRAAPDPCFFYRSQSHGNALDLVQHSIRTGAGAVVITGVGGTGKTTLCQEILNDLDGQVLTSLVMAPRLKAEQLLTGILQDFGVISREESRSGAPRGCDEWLRMLRDFLTPLGSLGTPAALIVDDADAASNEVLQQLGTLASLSTTGQPLLHVILVGGLGLDDVLRTSDSERLGREVRIRYRLRPLNHFETRCYITHRVDAVAKDPSSASTLFTPQAVRRIYRASAGNPRIINALCDRALLEGMSVRASTVEADTVSRAIAALGLGSSNAIAETAASVLTWMRRRVAML